MIGKPRFKTDDIVAFKMDDTVYTGSVYIVDAWGTFEQDEEPSYDILVDNYKGNMCLFKHIVESALSEVSTK